MTLALARDHAHREAFQYPLYRSVNVALGGTAIPNPTLPTRLLILMVKRVAK